MGLGIFGLINKKTVNKVVDGAISGVDKLFFTKEEKADYLRKVAENQLEYLKLTINESTARSLTRRYVAVLIIATFIALVLFGAVMYGINPDWAKFVLQITDRLSGLALMVAGFYFGSYAIGQYVINPLKRNKNQNNEQKT